MDAGQQEAGRCFFYFFSRSDQPLLAWTNHYSLLRADCFFLGFGRCLDLQRMFCLIEGRIFKENLSEAHALAFPRRTDCIWKLLFVGESLSTSCRL